MSATLLSSLVLVLLYNGAINVNRPTNVLKCFIQVEKEIPFQESNSSHWQVMQNTYTLINNTVNEYRCILPLNDTNITGDDNIPFLYVRVDFEMKTISGGVSHEVSDWIPVVLDAHLLLTQCEDDNKKWKLILLCVFLSGLVIPLYLGGRTLFFPKTL